ncbi:hypothetical protein NKOR_08165 [Candidatus Nitrosopumilus koreensis AR1]|uniref:Uncharacterized protein n=1 Tax=Candidatus Nitrosopumilus koreensis AR1 TaxID=1229908 RepID=K0B7L8_9ARCH|nr:MULTISPECIES: hypothetical protein [Nitrosopumilus]AFS81494.1 hypothetical protein NKOR_08165 [Candidatus Nitrosopumilus koreensis AR1]
MKQNSITVFAMIAMMLCATTALSIPPTFAQTQVGVGIGAEVKIGTENKNDSPDDSEDKTKSETRIAVSVNNGKATVQIDFDGETDAYVLETDDEATIIASIESQTGLSEDEIRSIWDFKVKSDMGAQVKSEEKSEMESKTSVSVSAMASAENSNDAKVKAMQVIAELKQRLTELENRFQTIMLKLESGTYFGKTPGGDDVTNNYHLTLDGKAVAISDATTQVDYSGELFLESIFARDGQSKFKVTGGHIEIDGETYEVLFGKTRASPGFSGETNTMVVIAHVIDNNQNPTTVKLLVKAENNFEGDFGTSPESFNVVMPSSKVSSQWFLDGSGKVTLV